MPLSTNVMDGADYIAKELREGRGARAALGDKDHAFGWVGGMPVTLASFVAVAKAETMSSGYVKVKPSGTPVAKVAAGAVKPTAVAVESSTIALAKFAGQAEVQLEQTLDSAGLLPAIRSVLGSASLLAFEEHAIGVLAADAGGSATGADWGAALVAGQAEVLAQGGNPSTMVVSALDYAGLIGSVIGSAGFAADPASAIGSYLGSAIHVSPKAPAGTAYVIDAGACLAVEHQDSPLLTVDPFSQADRNIARLVSDVMAGFCVLNDAHVVAVTVA